MWKTPREIRQVRFSFASSASRCGRGPRFVRDLWIFPVSAQYGICPGWVRNTRNGVNPAGGRRGHALDEVNGLHASGNRRVIQLAAKFYF